MAAVDIVREDVLPQPAAKSRSWRACCLPVEVVLVLTVAYAVVGAVAYATFGVEERSEQDIFPGWNDTFVFDVVVTITFSWQLLPFVFQTIAALVYDIRVSHPWAKQTTLVGSYLPKDAPGQEYFPLVTVIVPAYNEEVGVVATLQSVAESVYRNVHVIVVNDGSKDATEERIQEFLAEYNSTSHATSQQPHIPIRYVYKPNGGKATAIQRGLDDLSPECELVMTIDADSAMDPMAIWHMVQHFRDPRVQCAAGNVRIGNRSTFLAYAQQLEYLLGFHSKRGDHLLGSVYIVGGAAACYRVDVLKEMGAFDSNIITEDIEMSMRFLVAGHKVAYASKSLIYTEGPDTFMGLCNQRLRWKFGRFQTFVKHRAMFFSLQRRHSKFLTWVLLPLVLLTEILYLLVPVVAPLTLFIAVALNRFLPLFIAIMIFAVLSLWILCWDVTPRRNHNLIPGIPVAFALFAVFIVVECQAMFRCVYRFSTNKGLTWNKWKRRGMGDQTTRLAGSPRRTVESPTDSPMVSIKIDRTMECTDELESGVQTAASSLDGRDLDTDGEDSMYSSHDSVCAGWDSEGGNSDADGVPPLAV